MNDDVMVSTWPRTIICDPRGSVVRAESRIGCISRATLPRSRPCTAPNTSMTGCTL